MQDLLSDHPADWPTFLARLRANVDAIYARQDARRKTMSETKPKWSPCPFCGSANTDGKCTTDLRLVFGRCLDCGAEGPKHKDSAEAMRLWNARAETDASAPLREALRAVLPAVAAEAERREESGVADYIAEMRGAEAAINAALGAGE